MGHRNDYTGEMYADRMNTIYKVIEEGEMMDMREGEPFSYPACTLKEVNGTKVLTIGKSMMDSVLTKVVMPKLSEDATEHLYECLKEFSDALDMAWRGEYFNSKETQEKMQLISHNLVASYLDRGYRTESDDTFCIKQTKDFLKNYTTYLFSHMEVAQFMKKKREEETAKA